MIRPRLPLLVGLFIPLGLALTANAGATASARMAGGCAIPHGGQHLGPTYLTALTVSGTSCGTGLAVVRAYHACQLRQGGVKARCGSTVDGFRCSERRGPSIPTEFFSSVSCQHRAARVSYRYSQFT